jgi:hypothetical protein
VLPLDSVLGVRDDGDANQSTSIIGKVGLILAVRLFTAEPHAFVTWLQCVAVLLLFFYFKFVNQVCHFRDTL